MVGRETETAQLSNCGGRTFVLRLHLPDVLDARAELGLCLAKLCVRVREMGEFLNVRQIMSAELAVLARCGSEYLF